MSIMHVGKEEQHKRPIDCELIKMGAQTVIELTRYEMGGLPMEELSEMRSWIAREELSANIEKLYKFIEGDLCDISLWKLKELVDTSINERINELRALGVTDERVKI